MLLRLRKTSALENPANTSTCCCAAGSSADQMSQLAAGDAAILGNDLPSVAILIMRGRCDPEQAGMAWTTARHL